MRRTLLACLLALLLPGVAAAQDWQPNRAVRIVVPFPPGGISDSLARLFADRTAARLGQPVVVENRGGAMGAAAGEFIQRTAPDGHAYIMLSPSHLMVVPLLTRLSYDPMADLVPAVNLASNPFFLGVPRASPFQNLGNPSDMAPFLASGEVRVIASSGPQRSALAPEIATVAEQDFPQFRFETWNGLLAPKGTPPAAIARIAAAVREACADEAIRSGLRRLGSDPVCNTPAEFAAQMQAEAPVWRDVVQRSGVRID